MNPIFLFPLKVVSFLGVIVVLVTVHELGHYLFARLFKMGVKEFAVGFGPKVLTVAERPYKIVEKSGEVIEGTTAYNIRAFPLGGFVKILGMEPEEDGSEVNVPAGFYQRSPFARLIVLAAGPAFSLLLGVVLAFSMFMMMGRSEMSRSPILGTVVPEGRAYKAGLRTGDVVKSIDGKAINQFYDIVRIVREVPEQKLKVSIEREGKPMTIEVAPLRDAAPTPVLDENMAPTAETRIQGKLQILPARITRPIPIDEAAMLSLTIPTRIVGALGELFRSRSVTENLGGPVSIATEVSRAVENGFVEVINVAMMLTISLGLMNLLPVPPLDGGQMVVALLELLKGGKRISYKLQTVISSIGVLLILALTFTVLTLDLKRLSDNRSKPAAVPAKR